MTYFNDIGLLVVSEAFDLSRESIKFAPELATLWPESKSEEQSTKAGEICSIAGWGHTRPVLTVKEINNTKYYSEKLRQAKVIIKGVKNCAKVYNQARLQSRELEKLLRKHHIDEKKNICAIGRKGKPGTKDFVADACSVHIHSAPKGI